MPDWTQFLLMVGVAILIYLVRVSLPGYIKRKAENLAQKQDLAELTRIAASINSKFDRSNVVHRVQFEAEFQAYQALWSTAHDAVVAHIRWQSLTFQATDATITAFGEAQLAFANSVKRYEPFVPEAVFREFKALDELFVDAKIDQQLEPLKAPIAKREARKAIDEAAQRCIAAIKQRLSETLVV
jgi:hypothetical protein